MTGGCRPWSSPIPSGCIRQADDGRPIRPGPTIDRAASRSPGPQTTRTATFGLVGQESTGDGSRSARVASSWPARTRPPVFRHTTGPDRPAGRAGRQAPGRLRVLVGPGREEFQPRDRRRGNRVAGGSRDSSRRSGRARNAPCVVAEGGRGDRSARANSVRPGRSRLDGSTPARQARKADRNEFGNRTATSARSRRSRRRTAGVRCSALDRIGDRTPIRSSNQGRTVERRRDPRFDDGDHPCARESPAERAERRRGHHGVADQVRAEDEHACSSGASSTTGRRPPRGAAGSSTHGVPSRRFPRPRGAGGR